MRQKTTLGWRGLWTVAVLTSLLSGTANASDDEDEDAGHEADDASIPLEQRPVSLRETRGEKHADCEHRTPLWEHVVASGEHLGTIAGRYGVRRRDLVALNGQLANPDLIRPGQKLRVCPEIAPRVVETVEHVVAHGETLSAIASSSGMTLEEFLAAQSSPLSNPHRLRPGQVLRFRRDGGMVEAFLPPLPKPRAERRGSGRTGGAEAKPRVRPRVDVQLDAGLQVRLKRPHLAFGTAKTIRLLEGVVRAYASRHRGGPSVLIGDISKKGGGALHPHLSHRTGQDIDVGYVLRGEAATRTKFSGVTRSNLDLAKTWTLVKAFLDTHEVVYIFMDYAIQQQLYEYALAHGTSKRELDELFQYPYGRGRNHGIVRHWNSHKHHFHVRFR